MSDLRAILSRSPELLAVLEDVNVPFVHIGPSGRYEFSKLGRSRTGSSPIHSEVHGELCAALDERGGSSIVQEWSLRLFRGSDWTHRRRATVLIERLPASIVDRLPQSVLQGLKLAVKHEGGGLILGPPGSSKSSILAWLALQLPDESLLLISENPPVEIPSEHITHVFPPTTAAEERALQRLIRISPNVFWDRIGGQKDLLTVFACGAGKRRWFTADFNDPEVAAHFFTTVEDNGIRPQWNTVLTLSLSVIGRPEVTNFATREAGSWTQRVGNDALAWIGQPTHIEPFVLPPIAPHVAAPVQQPTAPAIDRPPVFAAAPSSNASDVDSPLTIPVEALENIPVHALEEMSEDFADFDQKTGMLSDHHFQPLARKPSEALEPVENVPEITRQYPRTIDSRPSSALPEPIRPSGFHPTAERPKTGFNPTVERPPIQRSFQPDAHTQNASNDVLRQILPMLRDEPTPPFNLDDLRITMSGEMRERDLDASKDDNTDSQPADLLNYVDFESEDDEYDDYSSVSQAFEDDIASMFTDDVATSVAAASNYTNFTPDPATSPTGRISDPSLLAGISESSVDREDATEEVNLGDKLRMMRDRFHRKD